jgi:hypothetical protein
VAFEEAGAHRVIPAPTPPQCVTGYLAASARAGKRSRTASPLGAVAACTVSVPVAAKFQAAKSWRGIQGCLRPDRTPDNSNFLQVNSTSSASSPPVNTRCGPRWGAQTGAGARPRLRPNASVWRPHHRGGAHPSDFYQIGYEIASWRCASS